MKPIIASFLLLILGMTANGQTNVSVENTIDKKLSFTNADFDMGKIPSGKPLEYKVTIKNISKDTLELQDVKVGCGCTTPKFKSGEKILPGKSTFISLGFNGGANGEFSKTADLVFTNGMMKQVKFHGFAFTDSAVNKQLALPN